MNTRFVLPLATAALFAGCATVNVPSHETLIAHRGESVDAPENTLPAYRMAVDRGFGFECDIYLSKDGQLFTFHDANLKRTTGGAHGEKCVDASWGETVSKVNVGGWGRWKGSSFDPTRPAKFDEVLALARPGRKIYVEVKGGDDAVAWVPTIRKAVCAVPAATPDTVLFICFSAPTCAELKRLMPEYKVFWLSSGATGPKNARRPLVAAELIATLRNCRVDGLDLRFDPVAHDAAFVREIKDAGFEFHVWTVDDLAKAKKAFSVGAETLTTNCARSLLDAYEAEK